ncbi:N-acetylmuramoyl-L-alanine amidase [Streptomyces sp. ISL-111]|uniref:peptidoglycan recognition protein family protein n=1 Tax=unclassified Streptomyces TaxID=2593676 RepID=UPI001BE51DF3|nr:MULTISPECIES: N-acetylmuramoyl-L-alanine amidase [unclassified Streptomyces]MBT2381225.1 N-acetylmuramoyl-L-alanine amidase [Streptomyces sp. ISL-111]MBT2426616.1 N-acetylmuramoyl-L-alanine amidase [Streptomyces sp. ISL-112]MBT2463193.1 N-acetylmuramoyl-L-alanine amidase [Streptomyces sp. ISL-63]
MRALLVTSVGVTCAVALTLPLATPAASAPAPHSASAPPPSTSPASPGAGPPSAQAEATTSEAPTPDTSETDPRTNTPEPRVAESPGTASAAEPAGSTQSLPLAPLAVPSNRVAGAPAVRGVPQRDVRPFSLVGVVWDDAGAELHGTVRVRTRATGTTRWSDWQDVETHGAEHAADLGSAEREGRTVRGATAPLWVGDSDGVEVRVRPEAPDPQGRSATPVPLPEGMRLELVDPGDDPGEAAAPEPARGAPANRAATPAVFADTPPAAALPEVLTAEVAAASAVNAELAELGATVIPALTQAETLESVNLAPGAKPYIGPRPKIVTRKGWGADERLRERNFAYTKTVKAAFVHHSASGNNYTCKQAPSVLRSIYRYHVKSSGWRDFGYNFAVDKCGTIYEGRAGGVTKAVLGAHTLGFNTNTMGIAVLGSYASTNPPAAAVTAVSKLTAWKLGLFGGNPKGKVTLVSGGSNKYKAGVKVKMNVISGHRDGFATECPGARLYEKLGTARTSSAKLQGR